MSILETNIHRSWDDLVYSNDFLTEMADIEQKLESCCYFPDEKKIMRFMEQDLNSIKCVIIGMEPYASWYEASDGTIVPVATGRSFEVANVNSWQQKFKQSSLRNMLKTIYFNKTNELKSLEEIRRDISNGTFQISEPHEWFDNLENQGVMFLNATLTVEKDKPDSHTKEWKSAMDMIIKYIDQKVNPKWLLFGNKAQERIIDAIGDKENLYKCCHPRLPEFVKENIFQYVPEIEWTAV